MNATTPNQPNQPNPAVLTACTAFPAEAGPVAAPAADRAPAVNQRPATRRRPKVAQPTPHAFRRVMGTGHLFRQTGKGRSKNWSMQFYVNGEKRIKTSGTRDKAVARQILNEILSKIGKGESIDHVAAPRSKAWTFDDAAQLYIDRLIADGMRTYKTQLIIGNHLRPAFGDLAKLADITTEKILAFESAKLKTGLSRATVNSYLAALRRMFRLSAKLGKVAAVPEIITPDPNNARKGYFERAQFDAVAAHLRPALRRPFTFAYLVGWRLASEVLLITCDQIDRETRTIRIDDSKNGEGRMISYATLPAMAAIIDDAFTAKADRETRGIVSPLLFPDDNGQPLTANPCPSQPKGSLKKPIRAEFNAACKAGGVTGRKPHDMRRTAARNLVTIAGVPEKLAMAITGHKTRDVFDRYHIVNPRDVAGALAQLAATSAGAPLVVAEPPAV